MTDPDRIAQIRERLAALHDDPVSAVDRTKEDARLLGIELPWVLTALSESQVQIAKLEKRLDREEDSHGRTIDERDSRENQVTRIYRALGGTGEWSNNNDLGEEAIELIAESQAREAAKDARIAELERRKLAVRECFLEMLASGDFKEDIDGDARDDGTPYMIVHYEIRSEAQPFEELCEAIGIKITFYDDTMMAAITRAMEEPPAAIASQPRDGNQEDVK